eukprot:COSAG01_NODE_19532_length_1004_cov_3.037569_1_plen_75_part_00
MPGHTSLIASFMRRPPAGALGELPREQEQVQRERVGGEEEEEEEEKVVVVRAAEWQGLALASMLSRRRDRQLDC